MGFGSIDFNSPLTLSHNQNLTQLTVSAFLLCDRVTGLCEYSPVPRIVRLVATSQSLKRLVLRTTISPWGFHVPSVPDFFKPLVPLVNHSSLEHIELRITSCIRKEDENFRKLVSDCLMKADGLKTLCNDGFLSVRDGRTVKPY
jgi:hypothetical protein